MFHSSLLRWVFCLFFLKRFVCHCFILGQLSSLIKLYVCIAPSFPKRPWCSHYMISTHKFLSFEVCCSASEPGYKAVKMRNYGEDAKLTSRRSAFGLVLVMSAFGLAIAKANGAALPPEQKPRLCDDVCEKELENVWWDCISLGIYHYHNWYISLHTPFYTYFLISNCISQNSLYCNIFNLM